MAHLGSAVSAAVTAEVGVKPHYDPMGGGLGARPRDLHVLAHDELELAAQAGLDSGKVDLALALSGVGVADREQRARRVDRQVERRAGADVLVVDIAGLDARRPLLMRPMAGSGATPITPKNGRVTGTTTPGATAAVFASRSIGMMR
jgi:hypothetical protein